MTDSFLQLLGFLWSSFMLLAPMLLLGLLLAGLIHVLLSRATVLRWLSGENLRSVCASAVIGVPVPLCSCSIVPVVAEMRKKGASRSSCMSFLITAPETGADSILVTHAFFGLAAAVARPLVSLLTAMVAGVLCFGLIRDDRNASGADAHAAHCYKHGRHDFLFADRNDCYVGFAQLKDMAVAWLAQAGRAVGSALKRRERPAQHSGGRSDGPAFRDVVKHVLRYGFVELADDILFALIAGVALGGVLFLAIPDGLLSSEHARWISYPVMLLVGMPLYICASASTPIAAALVAKGLSPGAALIFLMTGPATNAGTIAIILHQFGARFGTIYVTVVIAVTTVLGIVVDMIVITAGITLPVNLSASQVPAIQLMQWAGAAALIALIAWRFRAGALRSGWEEMLSNMRPIAKRLNEAVRRRDKPGGSNPPAGF